MNKFALKDKETTMKILITKTIIVIAILILVLLWAIPVASARQAGPTILLGEGQTIEVVCKGDEILVQEISPDHLMLICRTWFTGNVR